MLTIAKELLLNKYVAYFLAAIVITASVYFAWEHYVAKPYIEQGKAIGRADMLPTIETLKLRLDSDIEAFKAIEASMQKIKANSEKLKAQVVAAQASNGKRKVAEKTRIEYIDRVVLVGATECEKTADAVAKVFR